jgi:hypothetical protein
VLFETPATRGVISHCLEPHDLWIAKAIANRPKDVEFCEALLNEKIVDQATLATRLRAVGKLDERVAWIVRERIARAGG